MYEELIDVCAHFKINPSQFLCLHLIAVGNTAKLRKYGMTRPKRRVLTDEEKQDLIDRELLIVTEDNKYTVSTKFKQQYYDKFYGGNEIMDMYPGFRHTEKGMIPLSTMDRNVFRSLYWSRTNGSFEEHEEIKKDVQYGIEHGLLSFGIEKFVRSEAWRKIRTLRLANDTRLIDTTNTSEHDF